MQLYYILSLKWSPDNNRASWWRQNGWGRTVDLSQAGVFSDKTIAANPNLYNNGKTTRAIKKEEVEQMARLSVQWSDAQGFR